jgi:hypothetical protein
MNLISAMRGHGHLTLAEALAPDPGVRLPSSSMTPERLATMVGPPLAALARASGPQIRAAAGLATWAVAWPQWMLFTRDAVVSVLIRLAVEYAIGMFAPQLLPVFGALEPLLARLLGEGEGQLRQWFADLLALLKTDPGTFLPPVRMALAKLPPAPHA